MVPVTAAQAQPTGSISGTVTDQGNAGLGAICVDAYDYRIDAYQSTTSTSDGTYSLTGLPAGSYEVEFRDCGTTGTGYQPAVWGSVDGYSGTPVVLDTDTSAVNGIDVQLALGGAIAGTVAGVGNVVGACVQAVPYPGYPNSNAAWSGTVIASDGSFRLRGLPAEPLHLKVEDCEETPSFATTWFQNLPEGGNAAPAQADAGPITVTVGQVAQLPQLEVTQPGSISGAVIDSATGEPVVGACVSAHSPNETPTSWGGTEDGYEAERTRTDGDGLYRLQGLAEGPWAIMVEPCGAANFERTWLHGKAGLRTADLITVIAGQNTQIYGIGVENGGIPTVSGGSLSGTITAPDGVTPVERACVNALPAGSAPDAWGGEVAWTQADGTYTLQGLAEGTYDITIDNCPRYGWGSDWERPEYLPVSIPDTVTITSANEARILDASFEEVGGKLTGRAVDDQGNPGSGVYVDVYGETTGWNGGVDVTGADGTFRLVGLPQGSYNVSFSPSPRSYALRQQSGPHEVPVNSDGSLGEVAVGDVALSIGGRFTAHVVDSAGDSVTGLQLELTPTGGGDPVPAWLDHIPGDYQGHYRPTTVPVGDYTLSFLQCNYVDEVNPCPSVGNQPVSVSRATTTDLETLQLGVLRTRTTLTSSPNPSVDGEEVILTATVTGPEGANVPTGSIEFSLGDLWFSPVPLVDGVAELRTNEISPGLHELSAYYSGDATFANSTGYVSHTVEGAVGKALSVTTVTSSDPSSVQGQTVTYAVQVAPSGERTVVPTGTVQLFDGSTALTQPVALADGQASIPVTNLAAGTRNIVARYSGDEAFASSAGSTVQQVDAADASVPTALALTVSPSQAQTGSTVTFVATVVESDGSAPSGTVSFVEGDQVLGTRSVDPATGAATLTTSILPAGTHVVSAVYSGDALFQGSRSGDATVAVTAPTSTDGGGGGTGGGGGGGGGTTDPAPSPDAVQVDVEPGETASSDPTGTSEPTPTNPVIASVTSPTGGTVSFDKILGEPSPDGYTSLYAVAISAPAATVEDPLRITFTIDSSTLPTMVPPEEVTLFRNGEAIEPCATSDGTATPDPCVSVQAFDGDDLTITVLSSHASEWVAGLAPVIRVAGANRVQTAVATSRGTFPEKRQAPAAVLARDDAYPDALVGGPLAVHKGGPLLLTDGHSLSEATRAELQRVLRPGATVYLLGGRAALSPNLHRELQDLGHPVVRLAGEDRYATAVTVAKRGLGDPDVVLQASGLGFADALSAAPAAAVEGAAILLTRGSRQAPATADYLAARADLTRYAVGGPAALADPAAVEVAGADRYATSTAVAERFFAEPAQLAFASGVDFPDALAGGAAAGLAGAPLLLVAPTGEVKPSVAGYLRGSASTVDTSLLYGGPAAVSDGVLTKLAGLLRG